MLFRIDEMVFIEGKKACVEFKMFDDHVSGKRQMKGWAFRIYSSREMRIFLRFWLEYIKRECEEPTFKKVSDIVSRYNEYVSRHDEKILLPVFVVEHGKIFEF